MTYEEALSAIEGSPMADMADRIKEFLVASIRLRTRRTELDKLPLGASRMGGVPDWPSLTAWPHVNERPMAFLAQIRLADVYPFVEASEPRLRGWLYFFYEAEQDVWGFDPKDRDHWRVFNIDCPLDDLERLAPPTMPEGLRFHACAVDFELDHTLPPSDVICGTLELEFSEQQERHYDELLELVNGDDEHELYHRMLGLPDEIQGDMRLECQLASNGLYCGDATGYEDPRAAELENGQYDWLLLLQIDTDEEGPGWMWGDCGRLYFWIREQDLERADFGETWMVLQCY